MAALLLTVLALPAQAKYSGGTGEPNDPYQIATAADLILLGESPGDYDKHFLLTADIDLDPNLPGRKVFDKAVIAPDTNPADTYSQFQGKSFTGVFDGKGHAISGLTIIGKDYVGLFGGLASRADVQNLRVVDVHITGSGSYIGGLAGWNYYGRVTHCYSSGTVSGAGDRVGGLVGWNYGDVIQCYSIGAVTGKNYVGGLVGESYGIVLHSVWDMETSGLSGSAGGVGLTTAEMMDPYILGLNGFANDPNWVLDAGRDYPRLARAREGAGGRIIREPDIDWLEGEGTPDSPYRIDTADQLILLSKASILWDKHFVLGSDINLNPTLPGRHVFAQAVIPVFMGVFDGNAHTISHLTITGAGHLGLFARLEAEAEVKNLGVVDVNITGSGSCVGGLVGSSGSCPRRQRGQLLHHRGGRWHRVGCRRAGGV